MTVEVRGAAHFEPTGTGPTVHVNGHGPGHCNNASADGNERGKANGKSTAAAPPPESVLAVVMPHDM